MGLAGGSLLDRVLGPVSRKLQVSIIVPTGLLGLPWPFLVPRRAAVTGAIGDPIEVRQQDAPDDAYVDEVLAELCDAMVGVFDAHKAAFGWGDKTLELL